MHDKSEHGGGDNEETMSLWLGFVGIASAASYNVTVTADPLPLLSQLQGNSDWAQNFNPTFVEASVGTRGKAGPAISMGQQAYAAGRPPHGHERPAGRW